MSLILSLETSVKVCSVALHNNGELVAASEVHIEHSHASKLSVLVNDVIQTSGIDKQQLKAIAVSSGPGSYTGLRIGTSTAKGLCFSLGIPLISLGTLDLLAYQMKSRIKSNAYLCPMIDARRMEVYCCIYSPSLKVIQAVEAKIIDESSFFDLLQNESIIFFGDGAEKCKATITHPKALFVDGVYASALHMGMMVFEKYIANEFEDLSLFEPHYLKEFMIKKSNKILN